MHCRNCSHDVWITERWSHSPDWCKGEISPVLRDIATADDFTSHTWLLPHLFSCCQAFLVSNLLSLSAISLYLIFQTCNSRVMLVVLLARAGHAASPTVSCQHMALLLLSRAFLTSVETFKLPPVLLKSMQMQFPQYTCSLVFIDAALRSLSGLVANKRKCQ